MAVWQIKANRDFAKNLHPDLSQDTIENVIDWLGAIFKKFLSVFDVDEGKPDNKLMKNQTVIKSKQRTKRSRKPCAPAAHNEHAMV